MSWWQEIETVLFVSLVILLVYFAYTQLLRYWKSQQTMTQVIIDDLEKPYELSGVETFRFELRESSEVKFSILGRNESVVEILMDEDKNAGFHSIEYDFSGLESGWYWYHLQTAKQNISRKIRVV